jgi:ankyrin repeat protein
VIIKLFTVLILATSTTFANSSAVDEMLYNAACSCDLQNLERALSQGANPDAEHNGRPALHCAAMALSSTRQIQTLRRLIAAGANVDIQDANGITALMIAAVANTNGNLAAVEELLALRANPSLTNVNGRTALHFAAPLAGRNKILQALVNAGPDLNIQDQSGETAVMAALVPSNNTTEAVRILLQKRSNLELEDKDGRTILELAVVRSNSEIVTLLIQAGAVVQSENRSVLHHLCTWGRSDDTYTVRNAELLIRAGADVNNFFKGLNVPLVANFWMNDSIELQRLLIRNGADVNFVDPLGNSPLMYALRVPDNQFMLELLQAGANPNLQNNDGESAIFQRGDWDKRIDQLVAFGANVDLQDHDGNTILMIFIRIEEYVQKLIDLKANLNIRNKAGKTALGLATDPQVRRILINKGAVE